MAAAVDLNEHPFPGHELPVEPVLLRAVAPRAADASLCQDAAHLGPAQVDSLPLPQQLGELDSVSA